MGEGVGTLKDSAEDHVMAEATPPSLAGTPRPLAPPSDLDGGQKLAVSERVAFSRVLENLPTSLQKYWTQKLRGHAPAGTRRQFQREVLRAHALGNWTSGYFRAVVQAAGMWEPSWMRRYLAVMHRTSYVLGLT